MPAILTARLLLRICEPDGSRLARILAATRPENVASARIRRKIGMQRDRQASYYGPDEIYFALARDADRRDDSSYQLHF